MVDMANSVESIYGWMYVMDRMQDCFFGVDMLVTLRSAHGTRCSLAGDAVTIRKLSHTCTRVRAHTHTRCLRRRTWSWDAAVNDQGRVIFDPGRVAKRYLATWFVVDAVSVIPARSRDCSTHTSTHTHAHTHTRARAQVIPFDRIIDLFDDAFRGVRHICAGTCPHLCRPPRTRMHVHTCARTHTSTRTRMNGYGFLWR